MYHIHNDNVYHIISLHIIYHSPICRSIFDETIYAPQTNEVGIQGMGAGRRGDRFFLRLQRVRREAIGWRVNRSRSRRESSAPALQPTAARQLPGLLRQLLFELFTIQQPPAAADLCLRNNSIRSPWLSRDAQACYLF